MRRREFLGTALFAATGRGTAPVVVPIRRIIDANARSDAATLRRFWNETWPEALREFGRGGIRLQVEDAPGAIRHTAGDQPIFDGVRRGVLNLVLTDHIPMNWDSGRALAGVTLVYDGYPLSVIAMRYARGNQVPWLSLNTVVHELLHAFLGDIFIAHPKWYQAGGHEWRTDSYATRLWLFHDVPAIRDAARDFVRRISIRTP